MKEKKTRRGGRADRGARILETEVRGGESQGELHHRDRQRDGKFHLINPVMQSKYKSKWNKDSVCACMCACFLPGICGSESLKEYPRIPICIVFVCVL